VIIDISIAVIAGAVLLLAIYLSIALWQLKKTLVQVDQTVRVLEKDTHELLVHTNDVVKDTQVVITNVKEKAESTQTVFQAIEKIGKQLDEVSAIVTKVASEHREKLGGMLAIIGAVMNFIQEWRKNNQQERISNEQK
jgi:uncharacterized protein YoxC